MKHTKDQKVKTVMIYEQVAERIYKDMFDNREPTRDRIAKETLQELYDWLFNSRNIGIDVNSYEEGIWLLEAYCEEKKIELKLDKS